jgi:hypothetical protein
MKSNDLFTIMLNVTHSERYNIDLNKYSVSRTLLIVKVTYNVGSR